jgi:hypothetical protein
LLLAVAEVAWTWEVAVEVVAYSLVPQQLLAVTTQLLLVPVGKEPLEVDNGQFLDQVRSPLSINSLNLLTTVEIPQSSA